MPEFALLVTIGLACLLLVAAAGKLRSPARFGQAVNGYGLLPSFLVSPVAWLVPALECVLAVLLFSGVAESYALRIAAGLLVSFAVAMVATLAQGRRPACGCGLGDDRSVGWDLIVRNVLLAALAITASSNAPPPGLRSLAGSSAALQPRDALASVLLLVLLVLAWRVTREGGRTYRRARSTRGIVR